MCNLYGKLFPDSWKAKNIPVLTGCLVDLSYKKCSLKTNETIGNRQRYAPKTDGTHILSFNPEISVQYCWKFGLQVEWLSQDKAGTAVRMQFERISTMSGIHWICAFVYGTFSTFQDWEMANLL